MKLIAIQNWQDYLWLRFNKTAEPPVDAVYKAFSNSHHPWGNGQNCFLANSAFLAYLTVNGIRFGEFEEA